MGRITRAQYGLPPTTAAPLESADGVAVHYLGTRYAMREHDLCDDYVRALRTSHMNNPRERWVDLAYNEVVCGHGQRYEGRGYGRRSGANGNAIGNAKAYAILALHGTDGGKPSTALLAGIREAIDAYRAHGAGEAVWGHRDLHGTECPGPELYAWVRAGAKAPAAPKPPAPPKPSTPAVPVWPGRHLMYGAGRVMTGDDVRTWQVQMGKRGWNLVADGVYGPRSADACRAFQREKGLAADGIVGPATWKATWEAAVTR